jgi:hypothetical protein
MPFFFRASATSVEEHPLEDKSTRLRPFVMKTSALLVNWAALERMVYSECEGSIEFVVIGSSEMSAKLPNEVLDKLSLIS